MKPRPSLALVALLALALGSFAWAARTHLTPRLRLADPAIRDQDDMCFWIHPTDPAKSTVITSDKTANRLFVYDLAGATVQSVKITGKPGNIDLRYEFRLGGARVDLVGFNNRKDKLIHVYRVDRQTRHLERVDDGSLLTEGNYGFCLYRSQTGALYAFTTDNSGRIEQFELTAAGDQVTGTRVRAWDLGGTTEACVADDESGQIYFAEEDVGIWKVGAEPSDPTTGTLIAKVGVNGLKADVEGLAIYYAAGGRGYLFASSQGSNEFKIFGRSAPHQYLGTFTIEGVGGTDGIDVTNVSLGPKFPKGAFAVHNNERNPKTVEVSGFEDLGLEIDTDYWRPRHEDVEDDTSLPEKKSFMPTDDARVRESMPTDVYGRYATMRVHGEEPRDYSYLKFEVLGLAGPPGRATLRLYCIDEGDDGGGVYAVANEHRGSEAAWNESSLTWENAPEISGPPLDRVGAVVEGTWVELDVTSAIRGDGTYSFGLMNESTQMAGYSTKEGAASPQLVIESSVSIPSATTSTFAPSHDARVREDKPDDVYGRYATIRIRGDRPTNNSYLKFDVAGLEGAVKRATLRLFCIDASEDGGAVYVVANDHLGSDTPWDESDLTWRNAPTISGEPLDREGAVVHDTWIELDVTGAIAGNGTYSFGLSSATNSTAGYSSKEGVAPPQLVIETGTADARRVERPVALEPTPPMVLARPRPNPFSSRTQIHLDLPRPALVRVSIHDVMGRAVRSFGLVEMAAGTHAISWDGRDQTGNALQSGVYLLSVEASGYRTTGKLVLSK